MRLRGGIFALLALLPGMGFSQLTEAEQKGIADSLFIGNFRLEDLKFDRRAIKTPDVLGLVSLGIDDPMQAADRLMTIHAGSKAANIPAALQLATDALGMPVPSTVNLTTPPSGIEGVPEGLRPAVSELVLAILATDQIIRTALRNLTPEQQRTLIEGLPQMAVEEPRITFEFAKMPLNRATVVELMKKVDLPAIVGASHRLSQAVEIAISKLRTMRAEIATPMKIRVGGLPIVIAGTGDDTHADTDARLTIDLGGNDRYTGRHGAGVGYSSVLIDMSGDDTYDVKDLSVGSAILGVGIARDGGGHDVFRSRSIAFGAGLAGVGLFGKDGGHDSYSSISLSQGFGMYGIGICLDTNGNDTYQLKLMGQGAGRTQGMGWLIDRVGSDQYRAGGLILNSPLFASAHYSFAQGFGMGFREDTGGIAGGIGFLTDHEGDDFYLGETYCQAASYWFSLGSLYDSSGIDTYSAYHYSQASAMHATGAYLFDLAGDDGYLVRVGASHAIGHDYGVAFLLDRAGDDLYSSRDSAPGIGIANGLGIFVEGAGIDRYHGPPGKGNPSRGYGSLGVFVDLSGADMYRFGLADGEGSLTPEWGTAYDLETPVAAAGGGTEPTRPKPVPGSQQKPSDDELAAIYTKASQWNVGTAQAEVADNLDKLVAIGKPALEWMLANRLASSDRLKNRTFVHVINALGDDGRLLLGQKAFQSNDAEMRNLILIAVDTQAKDIGALLPGLMEKPEFQMLGARAAGALKAGGAVPILMRLLLSEDKALARQSMISLQQIGDKATVSTANSMLNSTDMPTRMAAIGLIVSFPEDATQIGNVLVKEIEEMRVRNGLVILGRVGGAANLRLVATFLLDPRPGVRITALQQLDGRCPQEYRQNFDSLKKDPVPTVRAVANRVK